MRLLLICVLLLPFVAKAHGSHSQSELKLSVKKDRLMGKWSIAIADIERSVSKLDENHDFRITAQEFNASSAAVSAYITKQFALYNEGELCAVALGDYYLNHANQAFAVFDVTIECSKNISELEVNYNVFFNKDASHIAQLTISKGGIIMSHNFRYDQRRVNIHLP